MAKEVVTDLDRERRRRAKQECPTGVSQMDHDEIAAALRAGKSVMCNCTLGFMIEATIRDDLLWLHVPLAAPELRGPAQAEYVRAVLASWTERLAEWDAAHPTPDGAEKGE